MGADFDFARRGEYQSGQRSLDSSDPRLIRQAALCEAAGGNSISRLPVRMKAVPGCGAAPRHIARVARVSPLLDSLTNNQHKIPNCYTRPLGRGRHCGRFSIRGVDPKTGRLVHRRVNCGAWTCFYCGPRKARLAKKRIREEASKFGLSYFWTLTLARDEFGSSEDRVRHIRQVFNKFREYLKREHGVALTYICILEFTKRGTPHLHVLFDRYIPHGWVSVTWSRLGGGKVVWVKQVKIQNVARYLSKYLTKDLLLSAPKGARRITTSRAIKLFPKFDSGIIWEFLRKSIWRLLEAHSAETWQQQADFFRFTLLHPDEEGYLKCFETVRDG